MDFTLQDTQCIYLLDVKKSLLAFLSVETNVCCDFMISKDLWVLRLQQLRNTNILKLCSS